MVGSVNLLKFDAIAIVRKMGGEATTEKVTRHANRVHWFGEQCGYPVYDSHEGTELPEDAENVLFVSLGGDGTMLHASKISLNYPNSSVVGFNLGHLGFLANANFPDDMVFMLQTILSGEAELDERMVLEATDGNGHTAVAMNEFLFAPGSIHNMNDTSIFINNEPVVEYRGSGVIVSTATGSTAMALSAGGPIISPATNVMLIAPVLAHSLTVHPIITTGRDTIRIETKSTQDLVISADGQPTEFNNRQGKREEGPFAQNRVEIIRHAQAVRIWRTANWQFFNTLSTKMGWNT